MIKIVRDAEGRHFVDGKPFEPKGLRLYRKKTLTAAVMMTEPFSVETLEGTMEKKKAGDWLMVGVKGEMYPCDAEVFAETYVLVGSREDVPPMIREARRILTVWSNGTYKVQSEGDDYYSRSDPDWIASIPLAELL